MKKVITINDYPFEMDILGTGQPIWLFCHGFMGSKADYQSIQPTGTRIYLNLLGFGVNAPTVSQPQQFDVYQQVMSIRYLLEQLDIVHVNLVGYSMGARLALAFAIYCPERVQYLVLESGTAGLTTQPLRQKRVIADTKKADYVQQVGMTAFVTEWEQLPLFQSQQMLSETQRQFMHHQRVHQNAVNVANSLRYFGTGAMPNFWPQLQSIQIPVTLITGENDQKFTHINEKMAALLPNVVWQSVSQAGHNVHFEQPQSVTSILNQINS